MCCKEGTRKRPAKKPKKKPVEDGKPIHPLLAISGVRTASGRWPFYGSEGTGPQTSVSVIGEPLDFNNQARSAPIVPPITESELSGIATTTKPTISFDPESIGPPPSKPILIPNSARIISAGQARSTAYAAKQVKFATTDETDTDSDNELPSHKNLLRSFVATRADKGKTRECKPRMVESDTGVDRNNCVDHIASQKTQNSEGEREKGNPGYGRFMFDDVLESANMTI